MGEDKPSTAVVPCFATAQEGQALHGGNARLRSGTGKQPC